MRDTYDVLIDYDYDSVDYSIVAPKINGYVVTVVQWRYSPTVPLWVDSEQLHPVVLNRFHFTTYASAKLWRAYLLGQKPWHPYHLLSEQQYEASHA